LKLFCAGIETSCIFSSITFAGGITGGTTKNTTKKQSYQTSGNNQQCRKNSISPGVFKLGKKITNKFFPITGTSEKLIKGMKWSADKQRELGGVPPTGSTVKRK